MNLHFHVHNALNDEDIDAVLQQFTNAMARQRVAVFPHLWQGRRSIIIGELIGGSPEDPGSTIEAFIPFARLITRAEIVAECAGRN